MSRLFSDKSDAPAEQSLKAGLGEAYTCYEELIESAGEFRGEWNYTKNGWILKLAGRKKALFYLIPLSGAFRISLTLREGEKDAVINDPKMGFVHEALASAKKYTEGYALQFLIDSREACQEFKIFLTKLIGFRQNG